jgi:hypothetical protein
MAVFYPHIAGFFSHFMVLLTKDKKMTRTIQAHSICTIKKTLKPKLTEAEEITCDILAICDSMNKLCETLSRLDYVLQRKNIEKSLQRSV